MRPLSPEKRNIILKAARQGQSTRQIANSVGTHHSTVARTIKNSNQRFQPYNLGRPKKLTAREERLLVRKISSGSWLTAVEAQQHLQTDYNIHLAV
jgi:transposase